MWSGGNRKNNNMPPYSCSQSASTPPPLAPSTARILLCHLCLSHRHASILVSNKSMRCMQQFCCCQLRKQKMAHLHDSSIREIFDNESTSVCASVCVCVRGCVIKYRTQQANIYFAHISITIVECLLYYRVCVVIITFKSNEFYEVMYVLKWLPTFEGLMRSSIY